MNTDSQLSSTNQARTCDQAAPFAARSTTIETMLSHRSIRSYTEKPVSEEALNQIIAAMQAAPNWVNLQHVSVVSVTNSESRKHFASLCGNQNHIAQAPVFLVFCADFYRTELAFEKHRQAFEGVVSTVDNLIMAANEVGIAIEAAVVAAESLGLGTVVIGDIRLHALDVVEKLDLPKHVIPLLGLCIGHPAEDPDLKPRLPREAVFFEERYDRNLHAALEQYDDTYAEYLGERVGNKRTGCWTKLAADFYRSPYNHYPEVPELLRQQGFYPCA